MVEEKNPGREGPDPQREPREFDTHDAAHDPTPGTGQVSRNDTVLEPQEPDGGTPAESARSGRIHDSGWYEYRGSQVRVFVLDGAPCAYRTRWFRKIIVNK